MSSKLILKLLVVLAAFLLAIGKGKPDDDLPKVDITFLDRFDDKVRSDGMGAYFHGEEGVMAKINMTRSNPSGQITGTDDLLFDPDRDLSRKEMKQGLGRSLDFVLDESLGVDPVFACNTQLTSATLSEGAFLNVDKLGVVPVGQERLVEAQFNTSLGILRFDPSQYLGTGLVRIERIDDCQWNVTSVGVDGGGPVAVLLQSDKGGTCELGRFHVPFQMMVQLQTCP